MEQHHDRLIVITGAAGFIGSCFVRYLNELGIQNLVLVDHLDHTEKWKNLIGKRFRDILSKEELFHWLKGRESEIEAFVHLGACSNTMETDASYLLENNYRFSVCLAEYALTNGQRFVYASSAATYGGGENGFIDDETKLYCLQPLNPYGFSKQLFDQWVFQEGVREQLVGLKYFNVFGPNEWHKGKMASAILRMVPRILKGEKIQLFRSTDPAHFADGEQKRDFIYVKDVVQMTYAFLLHNRGGLYNVGSGNATTWNELASSVFHALQHEPNIEYISMPEQLIPNYQNYSCADMKKTNSVLGNDATCMNLLDSVSDYVNNYLIPGKRW
jgi:ADP-L-glycero-D-manno-heptose 6-epimerase